MTFLNFNLSLRLHRIGIKAASGFYYQKNGNRKDKPVYSSRDIYTGMTNFEEIYVPAYLSSDLDLILPSEIEMQDSVYTYTVRKNKSKFDVRYENPKGEIIYREVSDSPVEARARIIIYLNKKGMV